MITHATTHLPPTRAAAAGIHAAPCPLAGIIILGGAVRPSPLLEGIARSPFDLPLAGGSAGERLLDRWIAEGARLARAAGLASLTLRLMLGARSAVPAPPPSHPVIRVAVERDPFDFRGTGGVLHDIARTAHDDERLLVVSGAHLPVLPLADMVARLSTQADVCTVAHRDGTPSALLLVRCAALRGLPEIGFVDLKEQALPAIARRHAVEVLDLPAASLPIRTAQDYLAALRLDHRRRRGAASSSDPFAEDWQAEFSMVEAGAHVHATARLFDTVALQGSSVGPAALLVRTIVCPGGHVRAGARLVDALVTARGVLQMGAGT